MHHRKANGSLLGLAALLLTLVPAGLSAQGGPESPELDALDKNGRLATYRITIQNLTRGQVFAPPAVVTHTRNISLFASGEAPSDELALMAEDGNAGPLAEAAAATGETTDATVGGGVIPPGTSSTIEITGRVRDRLSIAGMLVNTNDAFFAVSSTDLPRWRFASRSMHAIAYDAGSEANNEDCDFIPGPSCEGRGAGVRAQDGAEGFVHVHAGVHGLVAPSAAGEAPAGLVPANDDWRNPVARITIQRIR